MPLPHLAYKPTVMGVLREGSLRMSAKALLYTSYPSKFSPSLAFKFPDKKEKEQNE